MHGTMFVHLRDYVEHEMGASGWTELLRQANLGPRLYLPIKAYPDDEMMLLVQAAATATSQPVPALLQRFGEYLAPQLVAMYRHLLKPHWRTVDVLEHVESTAHRAVRIEQPEATPPYLHAERLSNHKIRIIYTSARRLCHVATGIIRGLAATYGETVTIVETECMHRGSNRCVLQVTTLASA
jgi:predicted hydrocarbon binding protein